MIARIIIPLILLIVLPELYIDLHYLRRRRQFSWKKRLLWWIPASVMLVWAVCLAFSRNFAPENLDWLFWFLLLVGLLIVPKAVFALCSFLGWQWCRLRKKRLNWGNLIGFFLAVGSIVALIYGSTIGFSRLKVRHLEYANNQLPKSFDGYRVVLFSDLHVSSYTGSRQKLLQRTIDSINAQQPDAIFFVGDIQNIQPQELYPVMQMLSHLQAKDGVYSVLGNHDYSYYMRNADDAIKAANEKEVINREKQMGWTLLQNEHQAIRRGKDSIVVAGMENYSKPPYPAPGDAKKAMEDVKEGAFTVMLQHDPYAWRKTILPDTHAQLTLSGHTHGGQVTLFGWSPIALINLEWDGWYHDGGRSLFVTRGVSGFIPFRLGCPGEIIVLTLRCK